MPDFGIFRGFNEKLFGDKLVAGQLPTQLGLIGSENFGNDPDYQAVLDYATTQGYTLPSTSQQALQNQLLIDLKDAGVWSKLDTFAVFATDGDSDFALIDWIRLSDYTAVNSPTFTINGGYAGDGASAYLNTNFNPATSGVNYSLDDAGRFFWVDNRTGFANFDGTSVPGRNLSLNATSSSHRINQDASDLSIAVNFAVDEFHAINRTSSTNVELFTNTTQFSATASSVSVISTNQFFLRGGGQYLNGRGRFYAMGASLVSENTDFYNAINTYFSSI